MKTIFNGVYFSMLFIFSLSLAAYSQNSPGSSPDISPGGGSLQGYQINIEGNVLYDQTFAISFGDGLHNSQQFVDPVNGVFDCQGADDFVVPELEKWNIMEVLAIGAYFTVPGGPALGFNIYFYTDNAGVPGSEIIALLDQPFNYDSLFTFTVNLSEVVVLQPGKYWVSVQAHMEIAVGGQWGWGLNLGPILDPGVWQNPLDGFGSSFTTWTRIDTVFGSTGTEYAYALLGSPTIVPVELTSFSANVNNEGNVILNWNTATELNNQMFEIERKSKDRQFITIGFVNGYGTTTEPQEYNYIDNTVETGTYFYRLKQIDFGGQYEYSDEIEVEVNGPLTFTLEQNYPNPFNPSTNIKYSVPESGFVKLSVYNLVGEEVSVLVNGQVGAGFYEVTFDAANLPSGTYLYRLQAGNTVQLKKMLLMK